MLQITKGQQFPVQLTVMRTQDTVTTQFLLAGCIDLCFNVVGKQRQYALDGFTFKDNVLTATVNTAQLDEGVYTLTARGRYMGEWWRAVTVPLFEVVAAGGVLPTEPVSAQSTAVFSIHQEMTGALARIDALEQKPDGEKVPTEMKLYFKAWQLYNSLRWGSDNSRGYILNQGWEKCIAAQVSAGTQGDYFDERSFHDYIYALWKEAGLVDQYYMGQCSSDHLKKLSQWYDGIKILEFPQSMEGNAGLFKEPYVRFAIKKSSGMWGDPQMQTYSADYDCSTRNMQVLSFRYMTMDGWDLKSCNASTGYFCPNQWDSLRVIFAPNMATSTITDMLALAPEGATWQRIGEFVVRTDVDWEL